jgi:N-acetylglucosamine kinase-like BadF-type ATPase
MTLFIGIDGGGSTTRMFIQQKRDDRSFVDDRSSTNDRSSMNPEPKYFELPVSLKVRNGDHASSAKKLLEILAGHLRNTQFLILHIAIGLSGMSREENQEALKNAILAVPEFSEACIHIEGDATLALKAAVADSEEGVLLIAGTGSVAYARSSDGTISRVGGWGPETSDEGSGYWIGLRVLRHYLRTIVSGKENDELSKTVTNLLPEHVSSPREIANLLEREPLFPARLAPAVFESESEAAMGIIREGAECLSAMIEEVSEKLAYPRQVHLSGSIAKHPMMIEALKTRLDAKHFILSTLDDRASARKALEIARAL